MKWWVTKADRKPIGPVSTELVLQGIEARMVPNDALVCEVGGAEWQGIAETAPFSDAFAKLVKKRRFDPEGERTIAEPGSMGEFLTPFEESSEQTKVEESPFKPSEPPPRPWLERFDDVEEKTIADARPIRSSEPPPDR